MTKEVRGVCRDRQDDHFLSVALSIGAEVIVSGDDDLIRLGEFKSIKIIRAFDFIKRFYP